MKNSRYLLIVLGILTATVILWPNRPTPVPIPTSGEQTAQQQMAALAQMAQASGQKLQAHQRLAAVAAKRASAASVAQASGGSVDSAIRDGGIRIGSTAPLADAGAQPQAPLLPSDHVLINGEPAHPQNMVARMATDVDVATFDAALAEQGLRLLNDPAAEHGLAIIQTPLAAGDAASALRQQIKALEASGLVAYAEPDFILTTTALPTDSAFANGHLWGLRNTGKLNGVTTVAGVDIDAVRAWDLTTGSANVIVAVIDSGVRHTHKALAANMWRNPTEIAGNGVDDDGDGFVDNVFGMDAANNDGDPMDDHGHGTHVAGTIGAAANDATMTVGVAWNVRIMACKFLTKDGYGYTSSEIRCIDFAVARGAKVINASYGSRSFSQAQHDAIKRARDKGVLFVAAAGNEGLNTDVRPHYPSCLNLDNVISVAAVDPNGRRASWSNYGRASVDLGAPGVSILSSLNTNDDAYAWWGGTSMAAPHVSGVAALVLAHKPVVTLADLRARIINTARPLRDLSKRTVSGGMVNAYNAVLGSGDGVLELTADISSNPLRAGKQATLAAVVSDVFPVNNATVTAQVSGVGALALLDNGVAPDIANGDGIYTAAFTAPADRALGTVTVQIAAAAAGKQSAALDLEYALLHPPVNDNLAARIVLPGASGVLGNRDNFSATAEPGEPAHYYWRAGKSVWFEWTAPAAGTAIFSTVGSSFDTVMAVYSNTAYGKLKQVARDDDSGGNETSKLTFKTVAGQTYVIAVDGYAGWYEGNIKGQYSFTATATASKTTARR